MRFKEKQREDPKPDLTSLTDIMFILIIFLTVTTTFAVSGGINVNLPEASSQREVTDIDKLVVVIERNGAAFVDGAPASDAVLYERFAALASRPEAMVIVQADKTSLHGRVVSVMDLAQAAGVRRLAIATEPKSLAAAPDGAAPGPEPPAAAPGATAP